MPAARQEPEGATSNLLPAGTATRYRKHVAVDLGIPDVENATEIGRGGFGKSAMVCRLLHSLEGGELPDEGGPLTVDGIVYLSDARSFHRVNVPDLYAGLTRLLPGRGACHFCGPCERGCMTHSYFNSAFTTVPDAIRSGNCTLISNAMVYKVLVDSAHNRANGVLYIDRVTRQPQELLSRVVILCAQSQESVRILLNSATREYPNGLANSSGVLGHYLTAHVRSGGGSGEFPSMATKPSVEGGGPIKPMGVYIARFRNPPNTPSYKKFLHGYGYEGQAHTPASIGVPAVSVRPARKLCSSRARPSKSQALAKSGRAGKTSSSSLRT